MPFKRLILHMFFKSEVKHLTSRIQYLKKMRNSVSNQFTEDYYLAKLDEIVNMAYVFEIYKRLP